MATIKPDDIPLDKLDAVIERLQKEKEARIDAKVAAGDAIKVNVDVIGDEDIEVAKARALRGYGITIDKPVVFNFVRYRYPDMPDGSPNPMNSPRRIQEDASDPEFPPPQSHRYDDELARRPLPAWEPQELIVGEPQKCWTEIRRPGPNNQGEIAEGYYIVIDGRVHLADELGKAIAGYSDIAGLEPLNKARKLLRAKTMREKPDEFWGPVRPAQTHGGW